MTPWPATAAPPPPACLFLPEGFSNVLHGPIDRLPSLPGQAVRLQPSSRWKAARDPRGITAHVAGENHIQTENLLPPLLLLFFSCDFDSSLARHLCCVVPCLIPDSTSTLHGYCHIFVCGLAGIFYSPMPSSPHVKCSHEDMNRSPATSLCATLVFGWLQAFRTTLQKLE